MNELIERALELEKALLMLERSNGDLQSAADQEQDGSEEHRFYLDCINENNELMERKRTEVAELRQAIEKMKH